MLRPLSLALPALLIASGALAQAVPGQPRAAAPRETVATTGTAIVRGRATLATTGEPVRRVVIRVSGNQLTDGRGTFTDDDGKFELRGLPAGQFEIGASKGGFVVVKSAARPRAERARPITITAGEVIDKMDFTLLPGGVVTGHVVDELGDPVVAATIDLAQPRYLNGRRTLQGTGFTQTNDRGDFRAFGIPPGEYYLRVSPLPTGSPGADYLRTYYPGTANPAEAVRLQVAAGQEVAGINIALARGRLLRITGTTRTVGGLLGAFEVYAAPRDGDDGGRPGLVRADGSFEISGLTPGTYRLRLLGIDGDRAAGGDVTLTDQDVTGVVLTTGPGVKARGRIVFEGPTGRVRPSDVRVLATEGEGGSSRLPPGANEDGTFELTGLSGHLLIDAVVFDRAAPWVSKRVRVGGTDITDTGLDFRDEDVDGIEILMTQNIASVTGTVADKDGHPVSDAAVVVFADDPAMWTAPRARVMMARPDQAGRFEVTAYRPGRYRAIAVDDLEEGEQFDPELLENWRDRATRLDLLDGQPATLDLKVQPRYFSRN